MKINLNDPSDFTIENLSKLIATEDDSVNTQIRVTKDGYLYLTREVNEDNTSNILFRLETLIAGNGYVGVEASEDTQWLKEVFTLVKENWPKPESGCVIIY